MNGAGSTCRLVLVAVAVGALVACAVAPRREIQWVDPALGPQSHLLRGQSVLVACDAYDIAVIRLCQDRLSREVQARGALPLTAPAGTALATGGELDSQLATIALALGASAVVAVTMTPATSSGGAGSAASLDIGGFSFGGGGGAGVGLSIPVGGDLPGATGFAASGRITETRNRRLVWAATFVAAPSSDLDAQFTALSRAMLDSAQSAGLF